MASTPDRHQTGRGQTASIRVRTKYGRSSKNLCDASVCSGKRKSKLPMIDRERFQRIRKKHGGYASWAVWANASGTPKSNIGDMSVFDVRTNPALLDSLNPQVVMVGLNISRSFDEPFRNFHDARPQAQDYKIRFAFADTSFYGAYMTDIIKNVEMVKSSALRSHLRRSPALIEENVAAFQCELMDLGTTGPVILAFGADAHHLIEEYVPSTEYSVLIQLLHYSSYISQEDYRNAVWTSINAAQARN
jgi:hypothetical protein